MTNDMYLIESVPEITPILDEMFVPQRKVALLIHGAGKPQGPSLDLTVDLLNRRGYDYITTVQSNFSTICYERVPMTLRNVKGKVNDFVRDLTPHDIFFTAIFGTLELRDDGDVQLIDSAQDKISGIELSSLFAKIPAHHIIHYATPNTHAGKLAYTLSQARHPELGTRHIGISPTIPSVSCSLFPHQKKHNSREMVHPFHTAFCDPKEYPTLLSRFEAAARYHREHHTPSNPNPSRVYMRHGSVQPQYINP